jgi:predicted secreted protein
MRHTFAVAALLTVLSANAAQAGDTAALNILGFSAEGNIFAFEEYGVQDGSGFPYANRFYIDVSADKFMPGTPVRVRLEEESASIKTAREQAARQGQAIVADEILTTNRGYLAAFNAVTEESADPYTILANPRPIFPPVDKSVAFRLEETTVHVPESCKDFGEIKGFRLVMEHPAGGSKILHDDQSIPASRGCPLGYRLSGLQTFYPESGKPVFAVMIAVRTIGFEGPDYRWLAVTGRL